MTARQLFAWFVHLYSALGTVIAFIAILFIEQLQFREAFFLMTLAVLIDASDGTLARAARVKELLPNFDGDRLEDIIDYLNYVIVPCLLLIRANLLPPQDAVWLVAFPLIASAYGFCQKQAKTADHFFLGFPSYWNIVALYLYVLRAPLWLNAFLILGLSILVFVPIRYVYPSRSPYLRTLTNSLGILWGLAILAMIYWLPEPPRELVFASLFFPIYYVCLSLWLELRRVRLNNAVRRG
jgi:phosphatidylcholine synthase